MEHFFKASFLFAESQNNLGALFNKPFIKWHKKSGHLSAHVVGQYHISV